MRENDPTILLFSRVMMISVQTYLLQLLNLDAT